jgi:hypothetical protein
MARSSSSSSPSSSSSSSPLSDSSISIFYSKSSISLESYNIPIPPSSHQSRPTLTKLRISTHPNNQNRLRAVLSVLAQRIADAVVVRLLPRAAVNVRHEPERRGERRGGGVRGRHAPVLIFGLQTRMRPRFRSAKSCMRDGINKSKVSESEWWLR